MKKNAIWIVFVVVAAGAWAWYDTNKKPANDKIQEGVRYILEREPTLQPMYDKAMEDGVLTTSEAGEIVDKANELKAAR